MFRKNRSLEISAPKDKIIHGVYVRKLPICKYIKLLHAMEELPQLLIGKAFPGKGVDDMFKYFANLSKDGFMELISRLLAVVPEELMKLLSELLEIPIERLLEDRPDALSPKELLDVICYFWDLNDMTDFFENARQLAGRLKAANIGSSAGSQPPKASASQDQS